MKCTLAMMIVTVLFLGMNAPCAAGNRYPSRDCSPPCCTEIWDPNHPTGMTPVYQCVTGNIICKLSCQISCSRLDNEGGASFTCSHTTHCGENSICVFVAKDGDPAGCGFPQEPEGVCGESPNSCVLNCRTDLVGCEENMPGGYDDCTTTYTVIGAWVER